MAYWAGYVGPQSSENVADWYEKRVRAQHGGEAYYFVICALGSSEFLGTIWLRDFDSRLGGPELSIFVGAKERWNEGVGTDATQALTDFGFGFLDIARIWLTTDKDNQRSQHAFKKAGFVVEGTVRAHHRRRGRLADSVLMSMLREEWEALERPRSWDYQREP